MEIQTLIYFAEVAKTLNYSKAAKKCFISRQGIKQQIQSLTKEVGFALFSNEKNHLCLTKEGKSLLDAAMPVLREYGILKEKIHQISMERPLRLGICTALIPMQYIIHDWEWESFQEENHYSIVRKFLTLDECMEGLEEGSLDCVYIFAINDRESKYDRYPIYYPSVILDYAGDICFQGEEAELEDISRNHFFLMGKPEHMIAPIWRDMKERGLPFSYEIHTNTIDTFYHVMQGTSVIFDLQGEAFSDNGLTGIKSIPLRDYRWFVGILCKKEYANRDMLQALQTFLREKYPFSS